MESQGQPTSGEKEIRQHRRTLTLTLLWFGLVILVLGAGWVVFDQMTASRVHIVNSTAHSIQMTLSGTGFQQTVSVGPSSEQAVRLNVTADTALIISTNMEDGRSINSVGGYFTPGDGQTTQVIYKDDQIRVTPSER